MQKWSRNAKWYNRPPSLSHWIWLGWWTVSLISNIAGHIFNPLLTEFVMGSVREPSIFLKIISCAVFILMEKGILTMLKKDSFEVAYLSRFALLCLCLSWAHHRLPTRHILIYSYHLHHLNPLPMKMKMVQQENSNALLLIHRGKQLSVMLQTSSAWMAKLLHVRLPMLLFWYVCLPGFSLLNLIITISHSAGL